MRRVALPLLLATGITVANANSRTGFSGKDALSVSQPIVQHAEQMQSHQEFWKWQKKKEKEDALKFLMPEATKLTGSYGTLTSEQQKQFERAKSNLVFIENKGQWHSDVLYLCRMGGLDAWITKYGVNYTFYKLEEVSSTERKEHAIPDKFEHKDYNIIGHRVLMKLQNHNPSPALEGKQKQEGYYNYFIGNDPGKHATYVGLYKEAVVKNVYNGIDLRYYFEKGSLRYDYIVHPGADPSQIVFTLEGSDKTYVNEKGNFIFTTRFGEVAMAELKTYQEKDKKTIASQFIQKSGNLWSFKIDDYDKTQKLIIDPLVYSTFIGGSAIDQANSIKVDNAGNAIIVGETFSTDYDVTPGAFQSSGGGIRSDVAVTKLNNDGTALIYSTYIGGNLDDIGYELHVDINNDVYLTGIAYSANFPTTSGVIQSSPSGGTVDAFICKLNSTGTNLLYSTFLGGYGADAAFSITVDNLGNAYIAGTTSAFDFPVTSGAFQNTLNPGTDAFISIINSTASALLYSTYLGGNGGEYAYSIALDSSGNFYVTGYTAANNFPVSTNAYQVTLGGGLDVFVSKFNSSGALVYSTYLGGSLDDWGYAIAVDNIGNAYVTGYTQSSDFDTTSFAYQTTKDISSDVFISKLNSTGTDLIYSTYLGGDGQEVGRDIFVDNFGNAYVCGVTTSSNFDVTTNAYQASNGGPFLSADAFITKINSSGTSLLSSTYLGGSNDEWAYGLTNDNFGYVYITGRTGSSNFVTSSGAFQTTFGGGQFDIYVTKLCMDSNMTISLSSSVGSDNQTVCINSSINNIIYSTSGATAANVSGLPAGVTGNFSGSNFTISGTPTVSGTFNYTVTLTGGCGNVTATGTITVNICTGIEEANKNALWKLYPNPSKGVFIIQTEKGGVFELMDITGRVLQVFKMQNSTQQIQVSLPNGIYFICEKASGAMQKLILE